MWKNITLGLEYDFIRLNSKDHTGAISGGAIGPANQVVHSVNADIHAVMLRVNLLFGPGHVKMTLQFSASVNLNCERL